MMNRTFAKVLSLIALAGLAACSSSESSPVGSAGAGGGGVAGGSGGIDSGAAGEGGEPIDAGADDEPVDGGGEVGPSDTFAGCPVGYYVPCSGALDCNNWRYQCSSGEVFETGRGCTNYACDIGETIAEAHCADAGGVSAHAIAEETDGGELCVSCDVPGCKPKGGTCAKASDCCSCRCESGKCAL